MAGWFMRRGDIGAVVVGADRSPAMATRPQDRTYSLALLAKENGVPFMSPLRRARSTFRSRRRRIPIESATPMRSGDRRPPHHRALCRGPQPAFDVTPAAYITAIVTERGIHRPPYEKSLKVAGE